jgi:hypothetical protein
MNPRFQPGGRAEGQALTEFLVVALALLPLFLLIPLIAKYQDIAYQAQMASRYVAFDATVNNEWQNSWKDPARLAGEVRRRFFSNPNAPIKTNDTAGNFDAHRNLFWRGATHQPLIADFDKDVIISFGENNSPNQSAGFKTAGDGLPFVKTANTLGLKAHGIFTGAVTVKLAKPPAFLKSHQPFDKMDLSITRRSSLVIDGWDADSAGTVAKRIGSSSLVPGAKLKPLKALTAAFVTATELGKVAAPQLGELEFWKDVVPPDRMK